jgi:hypothetical protein
MHLAGGRRGDGGRGLTVGGSVELPLAPRDCGSFQTCNASLCPLDPAWRSAVHLPGEAVCRYLLAGGKAGAAEYYAGDPVFAAAQAEAPAVLARHAAIRRAVEAAAHTGIKGAGLRAYRRSRTAGKDVSS